MHGGIDKIKTMDHELKMDMVSLFHEGCFYETYGTDALVIADVFGYRAKTRKDGTITSGFSANTLPKVRGKLLSKKISYRVIDKGTLTEEKTFRISNRYREYGKNIVPEPYQPKNAAEIRIRTDKKEEKEENSRKSKVDTSKLETTDFAYLGALINRHGPITMILTPGDEAVFMFADGFSVLESDCRENREEKERR